MNYNLYTKMDVFRPYHATAEDMCEFHTEEYINFLKAISPDNVKEYESTLSKCNFFLSDIKDARTKHLFKYRFRHLFIVLMIYKIF